VSSGGNLYYLNVAASAASVGTTVSGTVNTVTTGNGGTGGLDNAGGVAIDGVGNVWAFNRLTSSAGSGITELAPTTSNGTTTVTALSPGGPATTQAGEFGFQAFGASAGQGLQIDSSGNLWINTTGNSLLFHTIAQSIAKGAIGVRP
jgi:hypothetical protein